MIDEIELTNFKCVEQKTFKLSKITVFCGTNSAGKSTVIQSLLAIKQSQESLSNGLFFTYGSLFNFGKVKDIFNYNAKENNFKIRVNDFVFECKVNTEEKKHFTLRNENEKPLKIETFQNDFVYLSAERYGSRASFDIKRNSPILDIGIYGEFALSEYIKIKNLPAPNEKFSQKVCSVSLTNKANKIFSHIVIQEAMIRIYPDFKMSVIETEEIDKVHNIYSSVNNHNIRPNNVGFGVSYVLPIIIAAVAIKPGGTLIIENPEVHLHPKAQSELIKILGYLSLCDVQVIVETHSDHIINGLRVFVKENTLGDSHSTIYSITGGDQNRSIKKITIDNDGDFSDLDDDFFDQIENDLMRLL